MRTRGFTLIEMLVSVALFTIVMVVALGALLAVSQSDLRAEVLKSAVNNLNFALDSMSRSIRTGTNYHCGGSLGAPLPSPTVPANCQNGSNYISITTSNGTVAAYGFVPSGSCPAGYVGGCVEEQLPSENPLPLTSPDVNVTNATFYVVGACSVSGSNGCTPPSTTDQIQPRVVILIHGSVAVSSTETSSFNLQTSITQREYDL